jgi:putative transposase
VFIPKYRSILDRYRDDLKEIFHRIAEKWGFEILALEIMPDHVHLFVSAPPKYAPAQIIKIFKGASSRELGKRYPESKIKGSELWTRSYFVATAGSADEIMEYIKEQYFKEAKKNEKG